MQQCAASLSLFKMEREKKTALRRWPERSIVLNGGGKGLHDGKGVCCGTPIYRVRNQTLLRPTVTLHRRKKQQGPKAAAVQTESIALLELSTPVEAPHAWSKDVLGGEKNAELHECARAHTHTHSFFQYPYDPKQTDVCDKLCGERTTATFNKLSR